MGNIWELERSETDVRLGGVCSALATQWRVDPVLVRILAVVLAVSHGIGLVAYLTLWWATRSPSQPVSPAVRFLPSLAKLSRPVIVTIAVATMIVVAATIGSATPFGLDVPIVIAALVYWGHRQQKAAAVQAPPSATAVEFEQQMQTWQQRIADVEAERAASSFPLYSPPPAPEADEVSTAPAPPPLNTDHVAPTTTPPAKPARRPWVGALLSIVALVTSVALAAMVMVAGHAQGLRPIRQVMLIGGGTACIVGGCAILASFAKQHRPLMWASTVCVAVLFVFFNTLG